MSPKDELLLNLMVDAGSGDCTIDNAYATWIIESHFAYKHRKGYNVNEVRCVFNIESDGKPTVSTSWHPETTNV